jgi:hypothetical protein
MDSGSNALIGVIVGVLLVVAILFWAFGGFDRGGETDIAVDLPNVEINPPGPGP